MRPVPSRKHHWALLALACVVGVSAFLSGHEGPLTREQNTLLAEAYRAGDGSLYANDALFGPQSQAWQLNLPAWNNLLHLAVQAAGPAEPAGGFRVLGAAALSLFLLGMYLLLYRQTHSTSVATMVAIMSAAVFTTSKPSWGLGPLFTVTPSSMYLAMSPLLVLLFMRSSRRWRVVWVFFLVGAMGNLHLWSAVNLSAVLVLVTLGVGRGRWRSWGFVGAGLAAAAVGAAPALVHYFTLPSPPWLMPQVPAGYATAWAAVRASGQDLFYPNLLDDLLAGLPLAGGLAIPAVVILTRSPRFRALQLGDWLAMLGSTLLVALGLHGLMQAAAWKLDRLPVIGFYQALPLVMLPLLVLFAQSLVHLLRLVQTHRTAVRAMLVVMVLVFMGTSQNVRAVRFWVQDWLAELGGQEPPSYRRFGSGYEIIALARWMDRSGQVAPTDLVFCYEPEIRSYGRRSLWCSPADMRYYYNLWPQRLLQFTQDIRQQRSLMVPPDRNQADARQIVDFLDGFWAQRPGRVVNTFVVIPAERAPAPDQRLAAAPAEKVGYYWKLYRYLPPPTSQPAGDTQPEGDGQSGMTSSSAPAE
jgi:hypothetical protein